jgi:hypothetical protein
LFRMRHSASISSRISPQPGLALAIALAALASAPARSTDIIGLYLGAAVGQAQVSTGAPGVSTAEFSENHSAWKFMAGVRPISLLAAEVAYMNFGNPRGSLGSLAADAKIDGTAAFGVLYLPIPVPFLDLYAKAGVARLRSTIRGTAPVIGAFRVEASDTRPAAGVGAQLKFGSLAVRAEYERFDVAGGAPGLLTVGLTKTFL